MAYTVLQYGEKCRILKSVIYDVHTPNTTKIRQKKQGQEFQIVITFLNANDPYA
jgi:Holliday junction resolvasome RuvABC DNA-binding subunit